MFFLHGCPDTRRAALPGEAAARRVGVRLIAVNRPGYGGSDAYNVPAPDELGHRFAADELVTVADAFGVREFGLLGMSVGGPYALACAARHPERVREVAVVAAPGMAPAMDPPCHRDDLSPEQRAFFAALAGGSVAANVALMRPDFEQYVACPVALWYGEYDPNAPPRNGRWFADHLADASLVVRPTAHLSTLLEHWDAILTTT